MGKRMDKLSRDDFFSREISVDDAIAFFLNDYKANYSAKFDETFEVAIKLNIDAKKSDQVVRGAVAMPNGLGKSVKIVVIASDDLLDVAKKSSANRVGGEDLIDEIKAGFLDFDVCVATSKMMPKIAAIAKILGPKGLMPNPKLGTVTDDVVGAVENIKKGKVNFRNDKSGIVHAGIGKISFSASQIKGNFRALYDCIISCKPEKVKGSYVKDLFFSTSQGPSIKLDLKTVLS